MLHKYSKTCPAGRLKARGRVAHEKKIWEVMEVTRIPHSELVRVKLERGHADSLQRITLRVPRNHKMRIRG